MHQILRRRPFPFARSQYGYYPVVNLVHHRTQPLTKNVVFMLLSSFCRDGLASPS